MIGRKIGYVRVSTKEQLFDRQALALEEHNLSLVFFDKLSGKDTERPALQECLAYLEEGDTLYLGDIFRLARNTAELLTIVEDFMKKGINVMFLKEGLSFSGDTTDPFKAALSKAMLGIMGVMAELDRQNIVAQANMGIKAAQRNGVKFGRANPNYGKKGVTKVVKSEEDKKAISRKKSEHIIPLIHKAVAYMKKGRIKVTQAAVADYLNERGDTTSGSKTTSSITGNNNTQWTQSKVMRVLNVHEICIYSL